MEDDDDWPTELPLGKELDKLQEHLNCPICKELFNNPQILRCGHSFCSLCIRKHLDRTINIGKNTFNQCPNCAESAEVVDLRPNRSVAVVVQLFEKSRPALLALLKQSISKADNEEEVIDTAVGHKGRGRKRANPASNNTAEVNNCVEVLNIDFPNGAPITKRMPLHSFHKMQLSQIKKLVEKATSCSKVRLRLDGNKDALEWRFREFVHLHNAQVDAINPKTMDWVINKINKMESSKDIAAMQEKMTSYSLQKLKDGEVSIQIDRINTMIL